MRPMVRIGVLLPAVLLVVSGCVTKESVQEMLAKKDAEVEQRLAKVEARVDEERQRLDGVSTGLKSLEDAVTETRRRTDAVMAKAQAAEAKPSKQEDRPLADTEVYFAFDKADLSDGAQTALLGVVKELQGNPTLIVQLGGYTDPKGNAEYNHALSQRRVEQVRRFLLEKGIPLARIRAVALGPITDGTMPDEKKRRVTVKLIANRP